MRSIQDKGKVWFPGSSGPVFALRVEETVFVPGMEEGEIIEYWIDREFLCVDLHDVKGKKVFVGTASGDTSNLILRF